MNLVIGNSYYWLSAEQYGYVEQYFGSCGYQIGPGGYYYLDYNAMDPDILTELYDLEVDLGMDLVQVMDYTFSNQLPTGSGF